MPSTPAPFAQAWPLSATQSWLNQAPFPTDGTPIEQQAWRNTVGDPAMKALAIACGRHLAWLMEQGQLQDPPHARHVRIHFLDALRKLRQTPTDQVRQHAVGEPFAHRLAMYFYMAPSEAPDPQAVHARIQQVMAEGTFRAVFGELKTCATSGRRLQLRARGWQVELGQMVRADPDPDSDRPFQPRQFQPLAEGDVAPPPALHATIPVPSGQLLIADWFRIPAFDALTRPIDLAVPEGALESTAGRAAVSLRYAQELGVVHVCGRSPSVLATTGAVKVGHLDPNREDDPAGLVGTVHADLRWTTIVDRAHLEQLLTPALGHDQAVRQVADHIAQDLDLIQVQVEPGTHHLYFSGDGPSFVRGLPETADAIGLGLEDFQAPLYALTRDPLPPPTPRRVPSSRRPAPAA